MAVVEDLAAGPVHEAAVSFVTGYGSRLTRVAYVSDLSLWLRHCALEGLELVQSRVLRPAPTRAAPRWRRSRRRHQPTSRPRRAAPRPDRGPPRPDTTA